MSKDSQTIGRQDVANNGAQPVSVSPQQVEAYESMLATVPDAEGGGYERILEQLAAAKSAAGLNAPWQAVGMDALLDRPLTIISITKMASDYAQGLPWFIVAHAVDTESGEAVTFTSGSITVVAQLAKAWQLQAFPLKVIPRQADRPTKAGYFAQRLEVLA